MDATSTATNHLQQQPETNGKISLANGNGHISSNGNINHNTNNNHVATNNIHSSSNNNANNSSSNNTNTMIANIPATSYASLHSPSPTPAKGCCCKNHILVITILCVYLALVFIIFSNIFLDDSRGRSNSSNNNNGNNLKHKSQINSVDAQNQNDRQQNFYYYLLNHVF